MAMRSYGVQSACRHFPALEEAPAVIMHLRLPDGLRIVTAGPEVGGRLDTSGHAIRCSRPMSRVRQIGGGHLYFGDEPS